MWTEGAGEQAAALSAALRRVADPSRAAPMAAYMKGIAPFFGVPKPERIAAAGPLIRRSAPPAERAHDHVLEVAERLWALPEREHQYVAVDLLRHHAHHLGPATAERLLALITSRSWWDSVDGLAGVVRRAARRSEGWVDVLDGWARAADRWQRRVALLSQWVASTTPIMSGCSPTST